MALQLVDGVLPKIIKEYNGRVAAFPSRRPMRFILERDDKVDHKKEAVEDFLSWIEEKHGESMVARIRR